MFSQRVRQVMGRERLLIAAPQSSVAEAARLMAGDEVSAVVVVDGEERPVGIFTGRDVVRRVLAAGRDPQATLLADVMTAAPTTIDPDKPFGYALRVMQERRFRHLPVLDNGKLVGIVSARDAMDPEMEEFVAETQRREGYR